MKYIKLVLKKIESITFESILKKLNYQYNKTNFIIMQILLYLKFICFQDLKFQLTKLFYNTKIINLVEKHFFNSK